MNVTNRIVTFLDLLGFSQYTVTHPDDAKLLLSNYAVVLQTKLWDLKSGFANFQNSEQLIKLNEICSSDSFIQFLPFSDSIFITSENPDKFIKQLSHYLTECFILTSNAYKKPESEIDPTEVHTKTPIAVKHGIDIQYEKQHWFPTLFRGGIAFGKVESVSLIGIESRKQTSARSLVGEAVIEAVALEKLGKGPRIFCSKNFVELVSNEFSYYFSFLEDKGTYELLWPLVYYADSSNLEDELLKFQDLFIPAANLWKALNHLEEGLHYYNFLKLIVKATQEYFKLKSHNRQGIQAIKEIIIENVKLKKDDLMSSIQL